MPSCSFRYQPAIQSNHSREQTEVHPSPICLVPDCPLWLLAAHKDRLESGCAHGRGCSDYWPQHWLSLRALSIRLASISPSSLGTIRLVWKLQLCVCVCGVYVSVTAGPIEDWLDVASVRWAHFQVCPCDVHSAHCSTLPSDLACSIKNLCGSEILWAVCLLCYDVILIDFIQSLQLLL